MFLFNTGAVENPEPKIVTLDEPLKAVGFSTHTGIKTVFRDIPAVGKKYKRFKDQNGIPDRKKPWSFVAVSRNYDEKTQTWDYILGDVVTTFANSPEELTQFEAPAATYAVFSIRPWNRFLWGLTISKMKQYAYESWLPNSGYEQAGIDFEYHDERSTRKKNPEIDLYIAIKKK